MIWEGNQEIEEVADKYQLTFLHIDCTSDKKLDKKLPTNAWIVTYLDRKDGSEEFANHYDIVMGVKWTYLTATMTNSETDPESKILDGVTEEFLHPSSIKNHISKLADQALKRKPENFDFESDTTDIDELADEIFDALHDHTHKYLHEE